MRSLVTFPAVVMQSPTSIVKEGMLLHSLGVESITLVKSGQQGHGLAGHIVTNQEAEGDEC